MVKGSPLKEPADQLKDPLIVIELVKLIIPLVTLMVSLEPGTPTGAQLFALNQSVEAEPVQVKVAAEHQPTLSKTVSQTSDCKATENLRKVRMGGA